MRERGDNKLPEGTDPNKWKVKRPEIVLGKNHDGTYTKLPPYVEVEEGVQVHPSRVENYLKRRGKK